MDDYVYMCVLKYRSARVVALYNKCVQWQQWEILYEKKASGLTA